MLANKRLSDTRTNLVQGEGEVYVKLIKAGRDISTLLAAVDAGHKQVDEPRQAVLVNRLDVGQVRYAKEQYLAGISD